MNRPLLILLFAAGVAPGAVRIVHNGGHYALLRDGHPYFVKGAVGRVHLDALRGAGGNSIRAGAGSIEEAERRGLTILIDLPFGKQRMGFDYNDAAAVRKQQEEIDGIVCRYKANSVVLAWALGNELEIQTSPEQRIPLWKAVNAAAREIHRMDPDHPVITMVGGAYKRMLSELNRWCPDLDAVGLNSYADTLTLPEDIAQQGWTRPYLVTEFGPKGHWQVPKTPSGPPD
jgi:hypothetical protein